MVVKHCDLLSYLEKSNDKDDKALHELIDEFCWRSIFTTKRDYTFLMPNEELIKKLAEIATKDEDKGYEKLRCLFINDKHKDLSQSKDLVTFNNKKIKTNFLSNFDKLKEHPTGGLKQVIAFKYTLSDVPDQESERVKRIPKPKKGSNENNNNTKEYTSKLLKIKMDSDKLSKIILYKLGSLLDYYKDKDEENCFQGILTKNGFMIFVVMFFNVL